MSLDIQFNDESRGPVCHLSCNRIDEGFSPPRSYISMTKLQKHGWFLDF
jgi:hypothetical protein